MMTKKDYIRAAEIVRDVARQRAHHVSTVRQAFVLFFQGDNPRFDQSRFVDACEPKAKV
jgi:hypothetical protein